MASYVCDNCGEVFNAWSLWSAELSHRCKAADDDESESDKGWFW